MDRRYPPPGSLHIVLPAGQDNLGSHRRKRLGGAIADSGRPTRDQGDFSVQPAGAFRRALHDGEPSAFEQACKNESYNAKANGVFGGLTRRTLPHIHERALAGRRKPFMNQYSRRDSNPK